MKKLHPILFAGALAMSLALVGCAADGAAAETSVSTNINNSQTIPPDTSDTDTQIDEFDFSLSDRDRDARYDEESAIVILFESADQIETITEEGTYIISGTSEGGQLVVDLTTAEDPENAKAQIVLDNLSLTNTTAPALLIAQADKVFITLAEGSTNYLSDGTGRTDLNSDDTDDSSADTEEESSEDATLYSHDDLTINGTGSLEVLSVQHHAIKCQDDLVIVDGSLSVSAGKDGIRGKDSLKIDGGTITVVAGDDGMISNQTDYPYEKGFVSITGGNITIDAVDDGIKGEALVRLAGGVTKVESSTEGVEGSLVWIEGGLHSITSSDDGINAAGDIRTDYLINITGGITYVDAEGDGLDSNNTLTQSGGTLVVSGPTGNFGDGALDAEYTATITGGVALGVDNSGMPITYGPDSTQGSLLYSLDSVQPADTRISLVDSTGAVLFSFVAPKEFSNLAFSSPELTQGGSYEFIIGGDLNGGSQPVEQEASANDFGLEFVTGGTLQGGESITSFTLSELVAQVSADGSVSSYSGGMMRGGGARGQAPRG